MIINFTGSTVLKASKKTMEKRMTLIKANHKRGPNKTTQIAAKF